MISSGSRSFLLIMTMMPFLPILSSRFCWRWDWRVGRKQRSVFEWPQRMTYWPLSTAARTSWCESSPVNNTSTSCARGLKTLDPEPAQRATVLIGRSTFGRASCTLSAQSKTYHTSALGTSLYALLAIRLEWCHLMTPHVRIH